MSDKPVSAEYARFLASVEGVDLKYREELDTAAQRALFRRAELVVGPHGAAFTNLLHANPQVGVVELFADRYVNVGPQRIANLKALAYEGEFRATMRIELSYIVGKDRDGRKLKQVVYSNEYPGSVNPGQFWRKREYFPANIMDPYNQ